MSNTFIVSVARPAMTALALIVSLGTHAVDSNSAAEQNPTASLLDQLLSPPAPLRDSASTYVAETIVEHTRPWFSMSGRDISTGKLWQFALDKTAGAKTPTMQLNGQRISSDFLNQALGQQTTSTDLTPTAEQLAAMQSIGGMAAGLMTLPANQRALAGSEGSRQFGQWLANAAQYASNIKINAAMPLDTNFVSQAPTETVTAVINSKEVTEYLEQHGESVSLLAQLLGWQKTGLLPSATDLQKMASDHIGAVTSSVERWSLKNVSFANASHATTNGETQEQMLQWQWSATNVGQYNNNSVADNEANFSANLRRLFGMNEYY